MIITAIFILRSIHTKRFHLPSNGMGMAIVVVVSDLDHYSHLDTKGRASGLHREIIRTTDVQRTAHRPKHGAQSEER